jgi:hypothetical protein
MICCGRCEQHCITVLASELGLLTLLFGEREVRCTVSRGSSRKSCRCVFQFGYSVIVGVWRPA